MSPVAVGIRDGVVQLVSILGGAVSSWARSHHRVGAVCVKTVLTQRGCGGYVQIHLYHQAQQSEATPAAEDEAAAETAAALVAASTTMKWLTALRLGAFLRPLAELGVEDLMDFAEVLTGDLVSIDMKPLQRRRFQQAALELRN